MRQRCGLKELLRDAAILLSEISVKKGKPATGCGGNRTGTLTAAFINSGRPNVSEFSNLTGGKRPEADIRSCVTLGLNLFPLSVESMLWVYLLSRSLITGNRLKIQFRSLRI